MLHLVHKALAKSLGREVKLVGEVTNCHHNYARIEEHFGERVWVTRKGAVSARRRAGDHSGLDGREELHRARQGQRGGVLLVLARRGPPHEPLGRETRVHREDLVAQTRASNAARTKA
jgi:tRNA-splicing ligase RtcB